VILKAIRAGLVLGLGPRLVSSLEEQFLGETHGIRSNRTAVCGSTPLYNISIVASPKSPPRIWYVGLGDGNEVTICHHIHHTHIHYTCSYLIPSLWAWPGNETVTPYLPHNYYACVPWPSFILQKSQRGSSRCY